jgi:hypothetical protein
MMVTALDSEERCATLHIPPCVLCRLAFLTCVASFTRQFRRLMGSVAAAVDAGGASGDAALAAAERRREGRARVAALADMADAIAAASGH